MNSKVWSRSIGHRTSLEKMESWLTAALLCFDFLLSLKFRNFAWWFLCSSWDAAERNSPNLTKQEASRFMDWLDTLPTAAVVCMGETLYEINVGKPYKWWTSQSVYSGRNPCLLETKPVQLAGGSYNYLSKTSNEVENKQAQKVRGRKRVDELKTNEAPTVAISAPSCAWQSTPCLCRQAWLATLSILFRLSLTFIAGGGAGEKDKLSQLLATAQSDC